MNGIDKITARIEADAVAEAAALAQETQSRCAQIAADAEKQAQERYWLRVREGMKSVEDRAARLASTADMEAKKSILAFKQETVASAFDAAKAQLLSMPKAEYAAFLADKAAAASVSGDEELIFNAKDRESCGADVTAAANAALAAAGKTAALTMAAETGDFCGGLIVRRGSVTTNCTVDALLEQARETMAGEIAALLFG